MLTNKQKLEYALQLKRLHEIMIVKENLYFAQSNSNHNRAVKNLETLHDRIIENRINNHIEGNVDIINHKPIVDQVMNTALVNQRKGLSKTSNKKIDKLVDKNIKSYQEIMNNRLKLDAKTLDEKIEKAAKKKKYQNLSDNQLKHQLKEEFKGTTKKRINRIVGDALHTNQCNISFATAQEQGYKYKVWNNGRGKSRVRPWHRSKVISAVELDDKFYIYGSYPAYMMYPGDLDGGAENVANCRCWLSYTNITPSNLKTKGTIKIKDNVKLTKPNTVSTNQNNVSNNKGLKTKVKDSISNKVKTVINKVKNKFKKIRKKLKINSNLKNQKNYSNKSSVKISSENTDKYSNLKKNLINYDINPNVPLENSKWSKDKSKAVTVNGKTVYGVGESPIDKYLFGEEYAITEKELTKKEFKFVKLYSDDGFEILNNYLRGNLSKNECIIKWDEYFIKSKHYISFDEALDVGKRIFDKGRVLKEDLVVVRRQSSSLLNYANDGVYISDSYLSTSISKCVNPKKYGDYINLIVIPKGTKILYIEGISTAKGEYEILFRIDTKLELVDIINEFNINWILSNRK